MVQMIRSVNHCLHQWSSDLASRLLVQTGIQSVNWNSRECARCALCNASNSFCILQSATDTAMHNAKFSLRPCLWCDWFKTVCHILYFTQQFGIFFIQSVAALGIPYLMCIFWERSVVQLTMVTCLNTGVQHSQGSPDGFGKTIIQVTEKRGLDYSACHGEWVRTLDEAVPDHRTRWKHKSL